MANESLKRGIWGHSSEASPLDESLDDPAVLWGNAGSRRICSGVIRVPMWSVQHPPHQPAATLLLLLTFSQDRQSPPPQIDGGLSPTGHKNVVRKWKQYLLLAIKDQHLGCCGWWPCGDYLYCFCKISVHLKIYQDKMLSR